jgi:hypothetical protein
MPVTVTDYLKLDFAKFQDTGALNAILDVDTKLFIDPHLIETCKIEEFKSSYAKILKHFQNILLLLSKSTSENDVFWRNASQKLEFREPKWLCIGYAKSSTSGSGIGPKQRDSLLKTAQEIIAAGISDPQIFELVGLIEEGVGPDRISDMLAVIITDDLLSYSQRIFQELKVPHNLLTIFRFDEKDYNLPANPFNEYPIVVLPRSVLRDLPIAYDWSDIDLVCEHNDKLRAKVNGIIGDTWKKATRSIKKAVLKAEMLEHPDLFQEILEKYKKKAASEYDFDTDRAGQMVWLKAARDYTALYPLDLAPNILKTPDDIFNAIFAICNKFRDLIENNAYNKFLFQDEAMFVPKKEDAAQTLFYGTADCYCEVNNIDVSREPNAGRGPVDFKFSQGYESRVLVEVKLSKNKKLRHGVEKQLVEYQKAEKTTYSVYLIIMVGDDVDRVQEVLDLVADAKDKGLRVPKVIMIDGRKKPSASHI